MLKKFETCVNDMNEKQKEITINQRNQKEGINYAHE